MTELELRDIRDALENMKKDLSDLCSDHYDKSLFWKVEAENVVREDSKPSYERVRDSYHNSAAGVAAARVVVSEWVDIINANLDTIVLENRDNGC